MKSTASARWEGSLKQGKGILQSKSGVLENTPYDFKMRFEDAAGTTPEELIAAAHAGCFSMQLSAFLTEESAEIAFIETECEITLEQGSITSSHLKIRAKVDGIDKDAFQQLVTKAEKNCPVSKLLTAAISTEATLE